MIIVLEKFGSCHLFESLVLNVAAMAASGG